ncbi:DUF427 domain-containing protein [Patulibacter sp. SYSU D01012]|uniref:DUF427 domain-containing protein n=1 Tax=Patulibacter sp. SYSU D01012 TaxID=2817381 RepID=UPI001B314C63|nr:DUF427 domain-containing protein [Patulibacter sp. SYSU D01012]
MTLTLGTGPLGRTDGAFNFDLQGSSPKHRLFLQPYGLRVRASVGGAIVLDTVAAQLLHETGLPPRLYAPTGDFRVEALERTDTRTHCPFKGDASYWSLTVGGRTVPDAVWAYEDPLPAAPWLRGLAALDPQHVEAWFVEDEQVTGGLRDPYHRVDAYPTSRPVEVLIDGEIVARTTNAVLVAETGLPPRAYVPAVDVQAPAGPGSGLRTVCPYKGEAAYWTVAGRQDVAWSYPFPLAGVAAIRGLWAFDDSVEGVEVRVG